MYVHLLYIELMSEIVKDARWNLRIAAAADTLVRQAATARHQNLTDFVIGAALVEAERVLADRGSFRLDDKRWNEFVDLLERPVRESAGLERLFVGPSVFE